MRKIRAIACEFERLFKKSDNYKVCEPYMNQVIDKLEQRVYECIRNECIEDDYTIDLTLPDSKVYDVVKDNLARTFLCTSGLRCEVSPAPSFDSYRVIKVKILFDDLISILY